MRRKKVFVDVPEQPDVEKFIFTDRPGTIYINLSCKGKGVLAIVPLTPKAPKEMTLLRP